MIGNGIKVMFSHVNIITQSQEKYECIPYALPATGVENCDKEGNVPKPVSVKGNDLPTEEVIPLSKQFSLNSHPCWDQGEDFSNCLVPAVGECISSPLSIEKGREEKCKQTEGAYQLMLAEDLSVVPELVLDLPETQIESVAAQENISLEQAPAEEGEGRNFVKDELLFREAPTGKKQPCGRICKKFAVPEGHRSDLLEVAQNESVCRKQRFIW